MLDGLYLKGLGVDIKTFSCATRFWRRRRRKNPKTAKSKRATPPITPPTIGATEVELLPGTVLPVVVDVAREEDMDVVVDDSVPFWIIRSVNVRGVESFP
jgi:hypothetical protein